MKTLFPVDDDTYARIGKAYLICSQYPDVFKDVSFKKFCSLFTDILDDEQDELDARIHAAAHDMYQLLRNLREFCKTFSIDNDDLECDIYEILERIEKPK